MEITQESRNAELASALDVLDEARVLVARLESLLSGVRPGSPPHPDVAARFAATRRLTGQETAVLNLLVEGKSNRLIARALGVAEPTVRNHLQTVYRKLGVYDRGEAISTVLRSERAGCPSCRLEVPGP